MSFLGKKRPNGSSWFLLLGGVFLALIPLLAYVLFVGMLHRNLPIYDDYIIQLELAHLKKSPYWLDKVSILFSQLNEHRLAYTRFWFWLVHALNGNLSYSTLILIGNLPLLGIWALFGGLLYRLQVAPVAFLPLGWLLFQGHYHSNSLWAMASLQNITIHFLYPLLFVLLLSTRRWAWWSSGAVAVWICYTSGNGFLALALGGASLLYQRRWRDTGWWIGLIAGLLISYFGAYQQPEAFVGVDTTTWRNKLEATLIFLGTHLDAYPNASPYRFYLLNGLVIGLPILLLTAWAGGRLGVRWWQRQPLTPRDRVLLITVLMVGFIVVSALLAVQNRLHFATWTAMTDSRYRLYSSLLVMTGYVQLLAFFTQHQWSTQGLGWASLIASVLLWVGIYHRQIDQAYLFRGHALAYYHNWTYLQTEASQALNGTVFTPTGEERAVLNRIKKSVSRRADTYPVHPEAIETLTEEPGNYLLGSRTAPNSQRPAEWNMLIFWGPNHYLLFPVQRITNQDQLSFWLRQAWFDKGYRADVIKWRLAKAPYRLGLLRYRADSLLIDRSPHQVRP